VHNKELHDLYNSPHIVRVIKCKEDNISEVFGIYWENKNEYRVSVGRPERKNQLQDPGIDDRIIFNLFMKKCDGSDLH
jgi:hypothetical protein